MSSDPDSPEPELEGPQVLQRTGAAASIAVVLAGLVGFAGYTQFAKAEPVSAGDHVSPRDIQLISDGFGRAKGALLPAPEDLDPEAWANSLKISETEAAQLSVMVSRGERFPYAIRVWDNFDQDGDAIAVTAGGITQVVPIAHLPTEVIIPASPGQPVYITGERDGGGGVTVAVELSSGPLPLPPLAVGQTVTLPLL